MRHALTALLLSAALVAPAPAQQSMHDGMKMPGDAPVQAGHGDMAQAMQKMTRDMSAAPVTGDPDRDFTAMMIPHHQGAVDMARLYLRDGRDPQLLKMARGIVSDQQREIALMRAWQAKHPAP